MSVPLSVKATRAVMKEFDSDPNQMAEEIISLRQQLEDAKDDMYEERCYCDDGCGHW